MLCPYCFRNIVRVHYRCINRVPNACPPVEDAELGAYQRLPSPPLMPRVFDGPPGGAACPNCKTRSSHGVCPFCHNQLPTNDVDAKSFVVALVGPKNSGKSHYIAVLINELQKLAPAHGAGLMALGEQTIRRYKNDFRNYLYDAHRTIPVTQPSMVNQSVRSPLIYRWSRETRGFFKNRVFKTSMLTFFDTAGEDLREVDNMDVENRYVALSNGIVFLLDPLQIPKVRELLNGKFPLPEPDVDPREIIERVTMMIQRSQGLSLNARIKIPIAVVFSKIDAVMGLLDRGSPLLHGSPNRNEFDEADSLRVHESVRAHLADWMDEALDGVVSVSYSDYRYFGVSSLGAPPSADGTLHNRTAPAPLRVEDPVLWLLSRQDLVRVKRKQP